MKRAESIIRNVLRIADIGIGRGKPGDVEIHNARVFGRIVRERTLGLGESYMDGDWDCDRLDIFFYKLLTSRAIEKLHLSWKDISTLAISFVTNQQSVWRSKRVATRHYDLGNDLFEIMLDKNLSYSCAYYKDTDDLDVAQTQKLDLLAQKLHLKPGQRLLDVGCGWGAMLIHAAQKYGIEGIGLTISKRQQALATKRAKGLNVRFEVTDYRKMDYPVHHFDAIVSIGMFEHVGPRNYAAFFKHMHRILKPDGLFALHTIGSRTPQFAADPWFDKYIFPGGILPTLGQICQNSEKLFIVEDVQNFGAYYDTTLMAWHKRFEAGWSKIKDNYGERFYRMWRYYLLLCAGAAFRANKTPLFQVVLSPNGEGGVYQAVR